MSVRKLTLVPFSEIEAEEVDWIWPGALARGCITLLVGDGEAGKTYAAIDFASRISRDGVMPDGHKTEPGTVIFLEAEDSQGRLRTRFNTQHAVVSKIYCPKVHLDKDEDQFNLSSDRVRLQEILKKKDDVRLVVISSINSYMPSTKNVNSETDVRGVLLPWARFAAEHGFAVLGIMHLTKDRERAAVQQIMGSGAFGHVARIILGMVGESAQADGERVLGGIKNNYADKLPPWVIHIDDDGLKWEDERLDLDMKELMETFTPREGGLAATQQALAAALFVDWPAGQLISLVEMKERAKKQRVQWHTVGRVRTKDFPEIATIEKGGVVYWGKI